MAVRFDASSDRLRDSSSPINYNAAYTVFCFFYLVTDPGNTARVIWTANNNNSDNWDWLYVQNPGSGIVLGVRAFTSSGTGVLGSTVLSTATWYAVAAVRSGAADLQAYVGAMGGAMASDATTTFSVSGRLSVLREEIGAWTATNNNAIGTPGARVMGFKSWQAALTANELTAEAQTLRPLRTANLYRWTPLWPGAGNRIVDYSGNGRNWIEGGTLTDEDNPPVGWGARHSTVLRDDGPDYIETMGGAIEPAATLTRQANKLFDGVMTPAGVALKSTSKIYTGGITPTGLLRRTAGKVATGGITPAATLTRQATKTPAGTIEPAGSMAKASSKQMAGELDLAGGLLNQTQKILSGALDLVGLAVKEALKVLAGELEPAGDNFASRTYFQLIAGVIQPAGNLIKTTGLRLAGLLGLAGAGLATLIPQVRGIEHIYGRWALRVRLLGSLRRR